MPLLIRTIDDLRERVGRWRRSGQRIALVPTMGNLHAGHLQLVRQVRPHAQRVIASIFVNPLQFGADEDFDSYPRTLEQDMTQLASVSTDAVFHPHVNEMYPDGATLATQVSVPELEAVLCGAHRAGHFAGVATVVTKLLNLVQPDVAIFGSKDFQQLALIRQMVSDLNLPVEIQAAQTVREADGLAMSSRNRYLDAQQRALAPLLYRTLCELRDDIVGGERDFAVLRKSANEVLSGVGFMPDYIDIVDARSLQPATESTRQLLIAAAAHLGQARLIDNIMFAID